MEQTNGNRVKNEEQDRRILWLEEHYSNFNQEMGEVKRDVAVLKEQVSRCLWWGKFVVATSIGALLTGLINIIFK